MPKLAILGDFRGYPHPNMATLWNLVILGFWPFPQHCQMVQIQNHQKLVKNAKISDFREKFTSKSGDAFEFEYWNNFFTWKWSTIVTTCCSGPQTASTVWPDQTASTVWPDDWKQKLSKFAEFYVKGSILSI